MSQNSILIVFVSSTFAGSIIWRIKGCVLQTLSTRSLDLAGLITHFLSFITGLNVFFFFFTVLQYIILLGSWRFVMKQEVAMSSLQLIVSFVL